MWVTLGLYWENGRENGNYYSGVVYGLGLKGGHIRHYIEEYSRVIKADAETMAHVGSGA